MDEIKLHISLLEEKIGKELGNLRIITADFKAMKREIDKFLDMYYEQVGVLFEELQEVEKILSRIGRKKTQGFGFEEHKEEARYSGNISNIPRKPSGNSDNVSDTPRRNLADMKSGAAFRSHSNESVVEGEIKRIYRRLAKVCHPDKFPDDPNAQEIFSLITDAYESRDLGVLVKMEQVFASKQRFSNEHPVERIERLEKQYDSILKEQDEIKKRKHKLLISQDYKLWEEVRWQRMCGRDMVAGIRENVAQKLADKREVLLVEYGILPPRVVLQKNRRMLA